MLISAESRRFDLLGVDIYIYNIRTESEYIISYILSS